MTESKTEEEARAAADAVLATWADLDGVPATDALSQARALLQIARGLMVKAPDMGDDATTIKVLTEIDAFLAGLPVTAAPSTWTEEQIREAWHTHKADPDETMIDAVLRELRGEP